MKPLSITTPETPRNHKHWSSACVGTASRTKIGTPQHGGHPQCYREPRRPARHEHIDYSACLRTPRLSSTPLHLGHAMLDAQPAGQRSSTPTGPCTRGRLGTCSPRIHEQAATRAATAAPPEDRNDWLTWRQFRVQALTAGRGLWQQRSHLSEETPGFTCSRTTPSGHHRLPGERCATSPGLPEPADDQQALHTSGTRLARGHLRRAPRGSDRLPGAR